MTNGPPGQNKSMRVVYTIVERGEGKSFWLRIGTAFENRDGSLNVILDAIPVNGRLQIRHYAPDEDRDGSRGASGNHQSGGDRTARSRGNGARTD